MLVHCARSSCGPSYAYLDPLSLKPAQAIYALLAIHTYHLWRGSGNLDTWNNLSVASSISVLHHTLLLCSEHARCTMKRLYKVTIFSRGAWSRLLLVSTLAVSSTARVTSYYNWLNVLLAVLLLGYAAHPNPTRSVRLMADLHRLTELDASAP